MTLVVDKAPPKEQDEAVSVARLLWLQHYGRHPKHEVGVVRCDGGSRKRCPSDSGTIAEKDFSKRRKSDVEDAVKVWKTAGHDASVLARAADQLGSSSRATSRTM